MAVGPLATLDGFRARLTSAEKAVAVVKDGDTVGLPFHPNVPISLLKALAARQSVLRDVRINQTLSDPYEDWPWYQRDAEEVFRYTTGFIGQRAKEAVARREVDVWPMAPSLVGRWAEGGRSNPQSASDVLLIKVSPPDENGFCSFGYGMWLIRDQIKSAKHIIAEIDRSLIRTFGDNYVHVSQIDQFVEKPREPAVPPQPRAPIPETERAAVDAMGHLAAELVPDGATFFLGGGTPSFAMPTFLGNKVDLGFHSEVMPGAIIPLVEAGVITGKHKTLNQYKVVATSFSATEPRHLSVLHMNPTYELRDMLYTNNPKTVASHDNMVSINTALFIDLTGQVASESIGPRMWSGTGGQLEFVIGAMLANGGRSIHMIQSTYKHKDGRTDSRIMPCLLPNQWVTVPRTFVDFVVTEYGWVNLQGKTQRERADALISIAHPDFRAELRNDARKLFWPD